MLSYLLVALLATTIEGKVEPGSRITTGAEARRGQFPYIALIKAWNGLTSWYSTGTVISQRWVLSCYIALRDARKITNCSVLLGDVVEGPNTIEYKVVQITRKKMQLYHPLLLQTLTDMNTLSARIMARTPYGKIDGRVVGFGHPQETRLTYAVMTCNYLCSYMPDLRIQTEYSNKTFSCPRGEKIDLDAKDTGGPLLLTLDGGWEFLVGGVLVNSKKATYGLHGTLLVYIRTSQFLPWMRKYVRDLQVV